MCIEAVDVNPWQLYDVTDCFKTRKICDDAVGGDPYSQQFVPDWFVTEQQIKIWDDDDEYCDDDELIKWCNGYKKRKAQKVRIKEELLLITWHPDRVMDWCMSEDEKRQWKLTDSCFKNYQRCPQNYQKISPKTYNKRRC